MHPFGPPQSIRGTIEIDALQHAARTPAVAFVGVGGMGVQALPRRDRRQLRPLDCSQASVLGCREAKMLSSILRDHQ
jgi:hypothetical protein